MAWLKRLGSLCREAVDFPVFCGSAEASRKQAAEALKLLAGGLIVA